MLFHLFMYSLIGSRMTRDQTCNLGVSGCYNQLSYLARVNSSFLFIPAEYSIVYLDVLQFIYPFTYKGHLSCFQFGAIMNKAGINIHVEVFM